MPALTPKFRSLRLAGRRGITLLELLVVMVILSIVTAASIPMLTTGVEQRRVREAARLVASYIGAAKSRAIETGRPAGIMVQRVVNGGGMQNYATTIVGVEVPQSYCGDTTASVAIVSSEAPLVPMGNTTKYGVIKALGNVYNGQLLTPSTTPPGPQIDLGWAGLVRPGDLIRFGYQSRWYVLYGPVYINNPATLINNFTTPVLPFSTAPIPVAQTPSFPVPSQFAGPNFPNNHWYIVAADGSNALPPPSGSSGVSYQIIRQPIKSAVQPLQMPEGTAIDLLESGIGLNNAFLSLSASPPPLYQNPIFTFSPSGAVGIAYYDSNTAQHLQSPLFLLIGRREGLFDLSGSNTSFNLNPGVNASYAPIDPSNPPNVLDMNNMWVTVGPHSSLIVTAENANTLSSIQTVVAAGGSSSQVATAALNSARSFAQAAVGIGGR